MRELIFLGDSLDRLKWFPIEAKREIGFALGMAQQGETHDKAKPFKGYPGVMEIALAYRHEAYRGIYALKIGASIYVLHVFQKKSKHGIKTPKQDLETIAGRFKAAKRREEENA